MDGTLRVVGSVPVNNVSLTNTSKCSTLAWCLALMGLAGVDEQLSQLQFLSCGRKKLLSSETS